MINNPFLCESASILGQIACLHAAMREFQERFTTAKTTPSELTMAEKALLAHCRTTCDLHTYDAREDAFETIQTRSLADVVELFESHSIAKYPREETHWRIVPCSSSEGREVFWRHLLPPSVQTRLHVIIVPETRKILRNKNLEDFVAMNPDDWWACLCSEEDLASCRESLSKGLCTGRSPSVSSEEF